MRFANVKIRTLIDIVQLFICLIIVLHIFITTNVLNSSETSNSPEILNDDATKATIESSLRPAIILKCAGKYKVAFTFDDGPHPTYTAIVVRTFNQHRIKAGFFLLGTSIQSFLSTHNNLTVHQFERPRIGYLLIQDYSLIEKLFDGHDIYLHGWLHEKINEMRLQTVVDNISTQLVELGLLKGFKPIYRAPWGIGTAPGNVKNKAILSQILNQMGIVPAYWTIDSKDYLIHVEEDDLINHILKMICKTKGGMILMHDNRPTTAYYLDRIICSIQASGHTIVSPGEINAQWNNRSLFERTKKYVELLRERIFNIQTSNLNNTSAYRNYRPVDVALPVKQKQNNILRVIDANVRYEGAIKVSPNINDALNKSQNKH